MFNYLWSDSNARTIIDTSYTKDVEKHIAYVVPLFWNEHCVECAAPECYNICSKYESREDGKCRLFKNGIQQCADKSGNFFSKVQYKEWGKLEASLYPGLISKKKEATLERLFSIGTRLFKKMPLGLKKKYQNLETGRLYSYSKTKTSYPELFLIECYNESESVKLTVENRTNQETLFRTTIRIMHGFNRIVIPFLALKYKENEINKISVYPDNNVCAELCFYRLDLVKLDCPLTKCINMPKIKCVVWDLDNTLWKGVLSEGDAVTLNQDAVKAIIELDKRGILNSIASKNNEEETKEKLKEFGLIEYFLCPQINWGMKSTSISKIATILDIGIDTFAFVDDMEYERQEVAQALPYVRTFDVIDINELLSCEDTDVPVTNDSVKRRLSYVDIAKRNIEQENYIGDLEGFVRNCDIKISIYPPDKNDYLRCYELIQRTNQLNLSGERLDRSRLIDMIDDENYIVQAIRAADRYGDYGLVGVAIYRVEYTDHVAILEHFVLSCRIARKLVEQCYIEHMIRWFAEEYKIKKLVLRCRITAKNQLLRTSLEDISASHKENVNHECYDVIIETESYRNKWGDIMHFFNSCNK